MKIKDKTFFAACLTLGLLAAGCESTKIAGGSYVSGKLPPPAQVQSVMLGIDVLQATGFDQLRGRRVGLITNQTGVNRRGQLTREILHRAPDVQLVALFAPEHGLDGKAPAAKYIPNSRDRKTGLPVYSLYGPNRKPNSSMLREIQTLVFDMQDIGVRSYTYISTMFRAMEAAGEHGIEFMVLDRPNPLGGYRVQGPPLEKRWTSFVGQVPVPYIHGMTVGELALMGNTKRWMKAQPRLKVIGMRGWRRSMHWAQTGLRWTPTSPNIPKASSPFYYATTGILGSLSGGAIGIGTKQPFESAGGKGMDPERFTASLNSLKLPGVRFVPWRSTKKRGWAGSRIIIDPNTPTDLVQLDLTLATAINRHSRPSLLRQTSRSGLDVFYKVYGSDSIRRDLERGVRPADIAKRWKPGNDRFRNERQRFLIY